MSLKSYYYVIEGKNFSDLQGPFSSYMKAEELCKRTIKEKFDFLDKSSYEIRFIIRDLNSNKKSENAYVSKTIFLDIDAYDRFQLN